MKSVSSSEKGKVSVNELPIPEPREGELLVRMRACGICGSDLEKVYGDYGVGSSRIGHELAGEIAVSRNAAFREGEHVFVRQRVPCLSCVQCSNGNETVCDTFQRTNVEPCGLSEYFIASPLHADNGAVIRLPAGLSFEEAAAAEPLSCVVRALRKLGPAQRAAIIGAGPVGIMFAMALRARGADEIFILDVNDSRLDFAKKFGVAINSIKNDIEKAMNCDAVIVATGAMSVLPQALKLARKGGSVLIFGVPPKNSPINYDANHLFMNEISVLTSGYSVKRDIEEALQLVASGKIDLKQLITHRFPIEESQRAFEAAHRSEGMKIIITA